MNDGTISVVLGYENTPVYSSMFDGESLPFVQCRKGRGKRGTRTRHRNTHVSILKFKLYWVTRVRVG